MKNYPTLVKEINIANKKKDYLFRDKVLVKLLNMNYKFKINLYIN